MARTSLVLLLATVLLSSLCPGCVSHGPWYTTSIYTIRENRELEEGFEALERSDRRELQRLEEVDAQLAKEAEEHDNAEYREAIADIRENEIKELRAKHQELIKHAQAGKEWLHNEGDQRLWSAEYNRFAAEINGIKRLLAYKIKELKELHHKHYPDHRPPSTPEDPDVV